MVELFVLVSIWLLFSPVLLFEMSFYSLLVVEDT